MKSAIILSVCGILLCSVGRFALRADVPQIINYQGKLTDSLGAPVNLETELAFAIYTEPSGGWAVWSEIQTVKVTEGIFNVLLGAVNPLEPDYFSAPGSTYLGIKVGGDLEMSPRQEIASVAYSLKTAGISIESGRIKDATGLIMPPGSVISYAGTSSPEGWMICNGIAVSRVDYADLFAVIGTAYGPGDGSTTFNIPDFRGKVAAGLQTGSGYFDILGKTGGAETHQLAVSEIPSHSHSVDPPAETSSSSGDHSHTVDPPNTLSGGGGGHSHNITLRITHSDGAVVTGEILNAGIFYGTGRDRYKDTADWVGDHQHWLDIGQFNSGNAGAHSHSVDIAQFESATAGGGEPHNILQPYQVINFIIKY